MVAEYFLVLAEIVLAFIAGLTFLDYLRHRDQARRDIALMFATLGLPVPLLALGLFVELSGLLTIIPIIILLSHPYFILRLIRHFRPLSARITRAARISLILALILYIPGAFLPRDQPVVLFIAFYLVGYFFVVESYVGISFLQEAGRSVGLARHRLRFLAGGSIVLAVSFLMLLLTANLFPIPAGLENLTDFAFPTAAILLVGSYYLGFTPPAWLHRYWQLSELQVFLDQINRLSLQEPQEKVLNTLCLAAVRSVGGTASGVGFQQPDGKGFLLQAPPEFERLAGLIFPENGVAGRAWQENRSHLATKTAELAPGEAAVTSQVDAEAFLAVPIVTQNERFGLLLVFLPYSPLFPKDDLAQLTLLTDRVALILSFVALIEQERQLVDALNQKSVALQEAHDTLELRVEERTAELAAVNRELQQFTYIISHDLRSPLVNLKGFVSELKMSLEAIDGSLKKARPNLDEADRMMLAMALDEDMPEAMEFIDIAASRMDKLVSTLLELSRAGHRKLNPVWLNMNSLAADTLKTLAHRIEEKKVEVAVDTLPDVYGDEIAMEQIMANLLTNAVNYLEPERPGQITVGGRHDGQMVTYFVQDNGRGIAPGSADDVFAPFRRIGNPEIAGEGMGLAYVQALVRRHNGRIWFESQPGVGTTFSFALPLSLPETAEAADTTQQ